MDDGFREFYAAFTSAQNRLEQARTVNERATDLFSSHDAATIATIGVGEAILAATLGLRQAILERDRVL